MESSQGTEILNLSLADARANEPLESNQGKEDHKPTPTLFTPAAVTLAKQAVQKWYHNVTLQRNVKAEDVKGMLVDDKYRHLHEIPQELLLASILKKSEENQDSNKCRSAGKQRKSVRWKEILEESSGYDTDACSLVDVHHNRSSRARSSKGKRPQRSVSLDSSRRHWRAAASSPVSEANIFPIDHDGPVGVLTSHLPEINTGPSAKSAPSEEILNSKPYKLPDVRNVVRRMRTRHAHIPADTWFFGNSDSSFNSRCSDRYFKDELTDNSRHYYFFQTFPRISNAGSSSA